MSDAAPAAAEAAPPDPGADAGTLPPLEWRVNPWKEAPHRAVIAVLSVVVFGGVLLRLEVFALTTTVLWIAGMLALSPAFWVLRCRVDEQGVARRLVFVWDRRPWSRIARARVGPLGLFVSPNSRPGALDAFRGLWLPMRGGSAEESARMVFELRRRVRAHGL